MVKWEPLGLQITGQIQSDFSWLIWIECVCLHAYMCVCIYMSCVKKILFSINNRKKALLKVTRE